MGNFKVKPERYIFSMNELLERAIWNLLLPIIGLIACKYIYEFLAKYMETLWVEGKVDEWVVIMRGGDMVKAGIGLKTFKGPFDQVARFPAKINRVNFQTENVTKEMQGIQVSGILVWTILKTGDGPFQAFKNLGSDLATQNPKTANDALVSMSSAIVRSCIANSTIN